MSNTATFKKPFRLLIVSLLAALIVSGGATAGEETANGPRPLENSENGFMQQDAVADAYAVPPPLVYQSLYPCQACHQKDVEGLSGQLEEGNAFLGTYLHLPDPEPRTLVRMHRDIHLNHADWMWCLNCHSLEQRNYLKLITGEQIPFEKSYRLCGQCHGSIYRDWKLGIHGRRVGEWNGKKLYLLCTHCHDPHQPVFRKLPGMDIPLLPSYGRWEETNPAE